MDLKYIVTGALIIPSLSCIANPIQNNTSTSFPISTYINVSVPLSYFKHANVISSELVTTNMDSFINRSSSVLNMDQERTFKTFISSTFHIDEKKVQKIRKAFEKEYEKFGYKLSINKDNSFQRIIDTAEVLSALNFESAGIQIKRDDYIKYTLTMSHELTLMITQSLLQNDSRVVYSLFENDDLIVADDIELKKLVDGCNNFLTL